MKSNIFKRIPVLISIPFLLLSCRKPDNKNSVSTESNKLEADTISLIALRNIPSEGDAIFRMNKPGEFQISDSGKTKFSYETVNFVLGKETTIDGYNGSKNSNLGQHITLILNNERIIHNNQTEFSVDLNPGHYVTISFLTRSNYESLKGSEAYVLRQFSIGNVKSNDFDLTGPNLFYHMPSGSYSGMENKNVLLDFYIINCRLSPDGYKIKASINNLDFIIDEWAPYMIKGLPEGESTIKLELIDDQGKLVNSPFNAVTRKISLSQNNPA